MFDGFLGVPGLVGAFLALLFLWAWSRWAVLRHPRDTDFWGMPSWTVYALRAIVSMVRGPSDAPEIDLCWRGDEPGAVWACYPTSHWEVVSQWWAEHPFGGQEELTLDQWRAAVSPETDVIGYGDQGVFIAFRRRGAS